jgi:cullin 2
MLYSYLNNQHIRKQKISEAELNYGSLVIDHAETMKEIGELGLDIWRRQMIEPLRTELGTIHILRKHLKKVEGSENYNFCSLSVLTICLRWGEGGPKSQKMCLRNI